MNLERIQSRIIELMSTFVYQVQGSTSMNRTDINRISEVVLIPLLTEVFGYKNLKTLNTPEQPNFPGIDLGDETARVAFQITASTDNGKIKETLTQFTKHRLYEKYDRLIVYILTKKQKLYSGAGHKEIIRDSFIFERKRDIIDYRDLLATISTMQISRARKIEHILEANFGFHYAVPLIDTQAQGNSSGQERWFSVGRLPSTGAVLVGRASWLRLLDRAWKANRTKLVSIVAEGGVGKTGLANHWLKSIAKKRRKYDGADYVWTWSFYNQGDKEGLASADEFISWGLRNVKDPSPDDGTPWDRGSRLAVSLRQNNGILILDGLEPLQHPPGPLIGRLRDHALLGFLREFAADGAGLCVITSRLPLTDLSDFLGVAVTERHLELLTPQQGERMLRGLKVKGTRDERIEAARAFKGHCLGLTLLASYLVHRYAGDPRRYREVRPLSADKREQRHARKVLNAYGKWFEGRLEHAILYAMSFFERSVDLPTIANLITTWGDWLPFKSFDLEELRDAVATLGDLGLLYKLGSQDTVWLVDTHPLIREHFSEDLRRRTPNAWRTGHAQLFQDLSRRVPPRPVSRDELEILHTAVRHGCSADCRPEALEVLTTRIFQLDELAGCGKTGVWD